MIQFMIYILILKTLSKSVIRDVFSIAKGYLNYRKNINILRINGSIQDQFLIWKHKNTKNKSFKKNWVLLII